MHAMDWKSGWDPEEGSVITRHTRGIIVAAEDRAGGKANWMDEALIH